MLTPEAAKARLESERIRLWKARLVSRIARLHAETHKAAVAVLEDSVSPWERQTCSCGPLLDDLGERQRQAVFGAFLPGLGEHVERMWTDGVQLPYPEGFLRRPFRAPHSPKVSLDLRRRRLVQLVHQTWGYKPDAVWIANWAPFLDWGDASGHFLAAVMNGGGREADQVFNVLVDSAEGRGEISGMGRHVTTALLCAKREEGWAFIESLLLAAQRQEGLRQVILETIDEAHPEAFRRMLGLILEHGLIRFSSTLRAVNVWLGFDETVMDAKHAALVVERLITLLDDRSQRKKAVQSGEPEDAYLALWCSAFWDAPATVGTAKRLFQDDDPERRWAATYLMTQLELRASVATLVPMLSDGDLRVAVLAFQGIARYRDLLPGEAFKEVEKLLGRLKLKRTPIRPAVWPWSATMIDRSAVADQLCHLLEKRPATRLLPHLTAMSSYGRELAAQGLAEDAPSDRRARQGLLALVGDPSAQVRRRALSAVRSVRVTEDEAQQLEELLGRKAGDLRRGVVELLLRRSDAAVLASSARLLAASSADKRLGGLELLRRLQAAGRAERDARRQAEGFATQRSSLNDAEKTQLDVILGHVDESLVDVATPASAAPGTEGYLGLGDKHQVTHPRRPADRSVVLMTKAARRMLERLDELVHEHRDETIEVPTWSGATEKVLLGDAGWHLPSPWGSARMTRDNTGWELPLRHVWEDWLRCRPDDTRDADGCELLRAVTMPLPPLTRYRRNETELPGAKVLLHGVRPPKLKYATVTSSLMGWLVYLHPPENAVGFLLDAAETHLARIPSGQLKDEAPRKTLASLPGYPIGDHDRGPTWRDNGWLAFLSLARSLAVSRPDLWGTEDYRRFWALERWVERPPRRTAERHGEQFGKRRRHLRAVAPPLQSLLVAYRAGVATDSDVYAHFLRPGDKHQRCHALSVVSGRQPHPLVAGNERFARVIDAIRDRVVQIELSRGETPTPVSDAALALRWTGGAEVLLKAMRALGATRLVRGWSYDSQARATVLSRIIRATSPGEQDTPKAFAAQVASLGIKDARLIELAAFAPQWATHVEASLGWPGLADAIWWMHAHTKDVSWVVDSEIRDSWVAEVAERTPLSADELMDGAVDVAWFERVHAQLGPERWTAIDRAAKYGSTSGGHKRAQLFAAAMKGTTEESALRQRIDEKRHQDSVRSLGLLPLPEDGQERASAVLERYQALQEFIRTSRQFGSQRQASEKRAAEIGLFNLARTAGFSDPLRLSWKMEAQSLADLAESVTKIGDVTAELQIDESGKPKLVVHRGDRALKTVPRELRGSAELKAMRARATELRRMSSRMRQSLELAMTRGDRFTGEELHELLQHPLLAPRLSRLVLVGDDAMGYPAAEGRALLDSEGRHHSIGKEEPVRIAHPVDMLDCLHWEAWQRDCLVRRLVQPFKQVFRELYVPTAAELDDGDVSRRYAGHQLQPRQAMALLGSRGWVAHPEQGVRRVFHEADLVVTLRFLDGWGSPVEMELPTLEEVRFHRRGDWAAVQIADIPRILFSEVMRDLDLVVSVAHAGGVDPEATASTMEMRASLVEETCGLLGIDNVRLEESWVLVKGTLGEYSIHLGSATVQRRPGGAICIVPVHGQHRGRIFLPFADDDPKTAEVVAKVLMLARDHEIQDPTILDQIRA